jgi:hypothetical protein
MTLHFEGIVSARSKESLMHVHQRPEAGGNDADASGPHPHPHTKISIEGFVADTLDLTAELLFARWKRAVGILWQESVRNRQENLAARERLRAARRLKNLRRIVRRALDDYHRVELERQRLGERPRL